MQGLRWWSGGHYSALPPQVAQVRSLVGEPKPCRQGDVAKNFFLKVCSVPRGKHGAGNKSP